MDITLLAHGQEYFDRSVKNRERSHITHVVFGSGVNYVVDPASLSLAGTEVYRKRIDSMSITGDTATISVTVPKEAVFTFGEVALTAPDGTLIALGSELVTFSKVSGTIYLYNIFLTAVGLNAYLTYESNVFELSNTRPDFDDLVLQMKSHALQKGDFDVVATNTSGNTLMEIMAGVAEFDALMTESAYQEAFPDIAKLDRSIYASQTMLRNRLTRKRPAEMMVTLTRTLTVSSLTLPAYTTFTCNGVQMFNRQALTFVAGDPSITASLYEGTVIDLVMPGTGQDYQFFTSEEQAFQVSDLDVTVRMNGNLIPVVKNGLWNYENTAAVQDFTDKFGRLMLNFGNDLLGTKPLVTDTIRVGYAITKGALGNDSTLLAQKVACPAFPDLVGLASTGLTSGGDEPDPELYARLGGDVYGGQRGAVTPNQYSAAACEYPGVIDAVVLAQRDLAPYDKDWFNVGKVVLLTSSVWTTQQEKDFLTWYEGRTMYSMRYVLTTGNSGTEPRTRTLNVDLDIFCRADADLNAIQDLASKAVQDLVKPKAGLLNRDVHVTDITDAILDLAPSEIDYIIPRLPAESLVMYLMPPTTVTTVFETGGTLPAGDYEYGLSSVDSHGETPIFQFGKVIVAGGSIRINWNSVPGATQYKLYGRIHNIPSDVTLITTITPAPGDTQTYLDDGILVPGATKPKSINTSGVHYPVLGTFSINVQFSRRRARG